MIVHVLPEESNRRLCPVLLNEGHIDIVHEVDEALRSGRAVSLAAPLRVTALRVAGDTCKSHARLRAHLSRPAPLVPRARGRCAQAHTEGLRLQSNEFQATNAGSRCRELSPILERSRRCTDLSVVDTVSRRVIPHEHPNEIHRTASGHRPSARETSRLTGKIQGMEGVSLASVPSTTPRKPMR